MSDINRALMVVQPKQPFLDWVQSIDFEEHLTLDHIRKDSTAYLVPQYTFNGEQHEIIEWCYDLVFEAELEGWYTDPELWPRERDLKLFLDWFHVEFHSIVVDLVDSPLHIIDYDDDLHEVEEKSNGN